MPWRAINWTYFVVELKFSNFQLLEYQTCKFQCNHPRSVLPGLIFSPREYTIFFIKTQTVMNLSEQKEQLHKQVSYYSERFEDFNDTLSKSNEAISGFRWLSWKLFLNFTIKLVTKCQNCRKLMESWRKRVTTGNESIKTASKNWSPCTKVSFWSINEMKN